MIIVGNGIRGSTCASSIKTSWSLMAIICNAPNARAPIDALTGFHPPKITIANAIHPKFAVWLSDHPYLACKEKAAPPNPMNAPPTVTYKNL